MKRALIVFQKNPEPGNVKTRLAKDIGYEKATEIYIFLLAHTHQQVQKVGADIFVYFQGGINENYVVLPRYYLAHQEEGDLGKKMESAFTEIFNYGYEEVMIIGSDCYELDYEIIEEGYKGLANHDLVIGPAEDGGYYLLGMKKLNSFLFRDKPWSTSSIYKLTLQEANSHGLSVYNLPTLRDIDTKEDLGELKEFFDID
ncbi:MAG TPA: TIGR04282 family arsenosugar biosynthesis glycosyltransferase [Anditalea sp.]|nr:TIGR04282 family arsenosugar biosynthesis glycosyltransferase [Anditalea sp.]